MKRFALATSLLSLLLLAGCGKELLNKLSDASEDQSVHEIDIHPPQLACSTGRHEFKGLDNYCVGLQDEELNQHCGQALRRGFFVSVGCPGTFTPYDPSAKAGE